MLLLLSAAGAVCAERVHPAGAGSGGLGLQTLLSAPAGSGRELAVQPAGAHRSAAHEKLPFVVLLLVHGTHSHVTLLL